MSRKPFTFALAALLLGGVAFNIQPQKTQADTMAAQPMTGSALHTTIAETPDAAKPLGAGDTAPNVTVTDIDGKVVKLNDVIAKQPTVLIFYRGGWCPFCNRHLMQLETIQSDLKAMGFQILAVSMDQPSELRKTMTKDSLTYTLLSDSDTSAVAAYGIGYKVSGDVLEKMNSYGISLDKSTGNDRHVLPNPAVFLIDTSHIIRFAHTDPDYKVRLAPDKILEAAKAMTAK